MERCRPHAARQQIHFSQSPMGGSHRPIRRLPPAFPALPASLLHYLPRDFNALTRHFPIILLPTHSRVLWGSTWRQEQSGSPASAEAKAQGSWSSTRGWGRQGACLWGISQCPALLAVHFSSSNTIRRPTYFLSFIDIPFPC